MMVKVPTWSVTASVRGLIPLPAGLLKVKWGGEASGDRRTKSQSIPSPERSDPGKGSRRAGEANPICKSLNCQMSSSSHGPSTIGEAGSVLPRTRAKKGVRKLAPAKPVPRIRDKADPLATLAATR